MTLVRLVLAWACGIVAADRVDVPLSVLCAATTFSLAGILVWRTNGRVRLVLALAACAAVGASRAELAELSPGSVHISRLNGFGPIVFRGSIDAEPDRRDRRIGYRVTVGHVLRGQEWRRAEGVVLVWLPVYPEHTYGEQIVVTAALEDPPVLDGFDYRAYLERRGIHSVAKRPHVDVLWVGGGNSIRRILLGVKDRARHVLTSSLPEPESSLATGILLGDARRMPAKVDDAFRLTNTTHVIAISGANVSLLVVGLTAVFGRLVGRGRSTPLVLGILALYTALVGADAAVVRAALMGGVAVFGRTIGRPGHAPTALAAAVLAMTVYRPSYMHDLGFQLSFAATLGLVWFTEPVAAGMEAVVAKAAGPGRAKSLVRLSYDATVVTLAAQLTTWPIIAYQVGQVSVSGLLANLLVLPAQPPLMALGGLTTIVGLVNMTLGRALAVLAWLPLAYTIRCVELTAKLPMASVNWNLPAWLLAAYYVGLGLWLANRSSGLLSPGHLQGARDGAVALFLKARSKQRAVGGGSASPWLFAAGLCAACALSWTAALGAPDGLLHVHVLDVGQGDAILVVTPNGRRMLVDGGPSPSAVLDGLGRRIPPWDRRLDVIVLTHPDADHVGGLSAVVDRYDVAWIVDPMTISSSADAAAWRSSIERSDSTVLTGTVGSTIVLDERAGVYASVLWPPPEASDEADDDDGNDDANDRSIVLRLTFGGNSVLLTGDIGAEVEKELVRAGATLDGDVLKVSHHGSAASTTPGFVHEVSPALAVIGVGADNNFGHPSPEVLARLASVPVWRTDRDGDIELLLDGRSVWVK